MQEESKFIVEFKCVKYIFELSYADIENIVVISNYPSFLIKIGDYNQVFYTNSKIVNSQDFLVYLKSYIYGFLYDSVIKKGKTVVSIREIFARAVLNYQKKIAYQKKFTKM